jgi:hypothetical protein
MLSRMVSSLSGAEHGLLLDFLLAVDARREILPITPASN